MSYPYNYRESMNTETKRFSARDRVLMYTRGMDIDPETGVELALESLRRSEKDADPGRVMQKLFTLLHEKGQSQSLTDAEGHLLVCSPAMNRRAMVAKDLVPLSLMGSLRSWLIGLISLFRTKNGAGM